MRIRKIGQQPREQFSLLPNAIARDRRLSFRARGVMAYINSHADGYHVNAESLAADGTEGRDAMRTAMNELIACNYLRRVRRQDEAGQWSTSIHVHIYGDAPAMTRTETPEVADEDFDEPTTGNPSSDNQPLETRRVIEDQSEDSTTSPSSAAAGDPSPTTEVTQQQPVSRTRYSPTTVPMVLQRRLRDMGVVDGAQWTAAWQAAAGLEWPEFAEVEAERYPEEHLTLHLIAQQEQGRTPAPSRWLRFYIEDRGRRIQTIATQIEQEAQAVETPQEREDRINRRLPPVWGEPAATEESGESA